MSHRPDGGKSADIFMDAIRRHGGLPDPPQTFIYFMQALDGGPVKIGHARDPIRRLGGIQNGNPYRLALTRLEVGTQADEFRLHGLFAQFRLEGEWFKPHPTLAAMADAIPDESLADEVLTYSGFDPVRTPMSRELWWERWERIKPAPHDPLDESRHDPITAFPEPPEDEYWSGWQRSSEAA